LAGVVLAKTSKIVIATLVLLSVLSSATIISYNFGTNYTAADWHEIHFGLWVRDNTPERSVFLTHTSFDCPPAFIGGRLVVESYINWPYGWGVPMGSVFQRKSDIKNAYTGSEVDLNQVVKAYNVSYVYVVNDELNNYPNCTAHFDHITWLKPVYTDKPLKIYQVSFNQTGG
jgi:hypothetical protein